MPSAPDIAAGGLPPALLQAADWLDPDRLPVAAGPIHVEADVRLGGYRALDALPAPCIIGRSTRHDGIHRAGWVVIGRHATVETGVTIAARTRAPAGFAVGAPAEAAAPLLTVIGCDVWIGLRAMVGQGCRIGHGAIVAPHSIVTADVPPYAVVGGNPAAVTRYRFPPGIVARLLAAAWWCRPPELVAALDQRDVEAALRRLEAAP